MIYKRGDEILSKVCREVDMDDPIDYHIVQECIIALKSEFDSKKMLGLAAPQVGYDICVFLMRDGVYINPKFTPVGQRTCRKEEGCASIPGLRGEVDRYTGINISYCSEKGEYLSGRLYNMDARVFQHEWDHLQGVLFNSKMMKPSLASLFKLRK